MDIRKLQRIIVDALEDVKAQDIRVFNTTGITQLFDRVVVASGTSNRQTKALAASVRDQVKQAGGQIVSMEGEETGEWVLVDLGDAVVHIMQPAIRAYYNLEEIWGMKPVALKSDDTLEARSAAARQATVTTTDKPAVRKATTKVAKPAAPARAPARKKPATTKAPAVKTAGRTAGRTADKPARKTAARKATVRKSG